MIPFQLPNILPLLNSALSSMLYDAKKKKVKIDKIGQRVVIKSTLKETRL